MRLPHVWHVARFGAWSFMFAAFLDAALDFDVLYLGVAILNLSVIRNNQRFVSLSKECTLVNRGEQTSTTIQKLHPPVQVEAGIIIAEDR
jgi:hypothetical protein